MSHVYVLALTSRDSRPLTVDGHRIEFINVEDLYAAIERRAGPPEASEVELRLQHKVVVEVFRRVDDLLPVRFGTWIDRRELSAVVQQQRSALLEALDLVRGRVQMTVRFPRGHSDDQPSPSSTESGTAYLRARLNAFRSLPADVAAFSTAVNGFVMAERAASGPDSSSSLYHLIGREVIAPYTAAMQPFLSSTLRVSGPWPPFAFTPDPWL